MDVQTDKRDWILNAAGALFVARGLGVPINEIAREAGLATGSVYTYFRSKDELVLELYRRIGREAVEAVVQPTDRSTPLRDRIMGYLRRYIDFIWDDPVRAALQEYIANAPVIPMQDAFEIFGPLIKYAKGLLVEGQEAGVIRPFPPDLANSFVRGAIRNTLKRLRDGEQALGEKRRRQIADMCWAALSVED